MTGERDVVNDGEKDGRGTGIFMAKKEAGMIVCDVEMKDVDSKRSECGLLRTTGNGMAIDRLEFFDKACIILILVHRLRPFLAVEVGRRIGPLLHLLYWPISLNFFSQISRRLSQSRATKK